MSLEQIKKELAPTGVLRAAINMSNALLVTGRTPSGDPTGVSPSMAAAWRRASRRSSSPIQSIADVDKPGVRIAVNAGAAYDLWLDRNIKQAKLVRTGKGVKAFDLFVNEKLEAFASLRPGLLKDVTKLPGARILDGNFATVQQAVGTSKANAASAKFLADFVEEAKRTGVVAKFIEQHGVKGLSVPPPA